MADQGGQPRIVGGDGGAKVADLGEVREVGLVPTRPGVAGGLSDLGEGRFAAVVVAAVDDDGGAGAGKRVESADAPRGDQGRVGRDSQ